MMWKNLFDAIRQRLTREKMKKLSWYGALAALLVILGASSYAYRNHGLLHYEKNDLADRSEAAPLAAMSAATPQPLEAMFVLPTSTAEPTPEPLRFVWPVEGEIIGEFAPDALIWSETLNQWQNHPGLDIAAAAGEAVVACAEGTVRETWQDPLWGNVIEIEHRLGYVSTYANLNSLNMVSPGDDVEEGQIIGAVGDSADGETAMPWHLHFELTRDGIPVDARNLFE